MNPNPLLAPQRVFILVCLLAALLTGHGLFTTAKAATIIWDGGAENSNWSSPRNWVGDNAPAPNDSLVFDSFARLAPANDFAPGTAFNGLTYAATAGAFTLSGNQITLQGDIVDNTPVLPQTINLPLALNETRTVQVVPNGLLTIGGVISGGAAGLTKTGGGVLTLTGNNSFGGPLTANAGVVSVASDLNLGTPPASPTAAHLIIDSGTVRTTGNLTLNSNRGIALGPTTGSGTGTIDVVSGTTLIYGGVMANHGSGTGGLTKTSFGGLTLSGANTYTGATSVKVGTLTLDFAQPTSPSNNIISSSSALTLGGSNAGLGGTSFAALTMIGGAASSSQTFNGTLIDIGPAIIRVNSGAGGATVNLGALTHQPGAVANFVPPASGNITTTTGNTNGILGGWATVGSGATPVGGITVGSEWAAVDGSGNLGPYTGHVNYVAGTTFSALPDYTPVSNVRINNGSTGDIIVETAGAGTITDINTLQFSEAAPRSIVIGLDNTLRLGRFGGIFRSDVSTANTTWVIGTSTGAANGIQNEGTLTAGGAPDTSGEMVFTINAPSQTQGSLNVEARVTDNGAGAVSVVKAGPGSMKFRGNNTYTGGTYILQGRFQLAGNEIGTANPDGWGTGPVFVMPGAQAFPSGIGATSMLNPFFIAGLGTSAEPTGAIRFGNGVSIAGEVTLTGNARLGGGNGGATGVTGKITGGFNLDFGTPGSINTNLGLFNPDNDWTGNTTLVGRVGGNAAHTVTLRLGANEVIPDGPGKGNLTINGGADARTTTFDLNGFNETINGLSATGTVVNAIITNAGVTPSTLAVGGYDQTSNFGGVIQDGAAPVALAKIGTGILTLSGTNSYSGATDIHAGTLSFTGDTASFSSTSAINVNASATAAGTLSGTIPIGNVTLAANNGAQIATIAPGATGALGAVGTLTMSSLAVNGGDLEFDLVAPGASDVVVVLGMATFAGAATISPSPIGAAGTYTLLTATGGLTLTVPPTVNPPANTRSTFTLDTTTTPNAIKLVVAGGPKTLTWTGATNNVWDVVNTTNWSDGANPEKFFTNDAVTFTNGVANRNINLAVSVLPSAVTVDNNTDHEYTIAGGGSIDGSASLVKSGSGTLIIATTNSYSGTTAINAGTVQVGNGGAAGSLGTGTVTNEGILVFNRSDASTAANIISGAGELRKVGSGTVTLSGVNTYTGTTSITGGTVVVTNADEINSSLGATGGGDVNIASGAALDLAGNPTPQALNFGPKRFNIAGSGVGGTGVLTNSGTVSQFNTFQQVALTADATVGGTGRFDIRGIGSNLDLAGQTLTKRGTNQFSLVNTTVTDGSITVEQGVFAIEADSSIPDNGTGKTITYQSGTTAQFFNLTGTVTRPVVVNGSVTMGNASAQGSTLGSNITLNGDLTVTNLNNSTGPLILSGNLVETGGARTLTKNGGTTLTLLGQNAYTGPTNLNGGLVEFVSLNNLGSNPAINFSGGGLMYGGGAAAVDVSMRTLTFNAGGGTIDTNSNDVTFANPIGNNGPGAFTKAGFGALTLTVPNTYSGPTNINGGALLFSALNQLGSGSAIAFGGGTLRYAAGAGNLDITTRSVTLNAGGGAIDTNGNNVTFVNPISGVGGLEKSGLGSLTLAGNSTYTGPTTINQGTLVVSGSLAGTTALNLNSGELRLDAGDRIADSATVSLISGTFETNGFAETLGPLTLGGSGRFDLGLGASVFRLADSSAMFWFGDLFIANWSGSPGGGGTDQVIFGSSNFALTIDQLALVRFVDPFGPGSGMFPAQILDTGEIVPVPEPSSGAALLSIFAVALFRRKPPTTR